MLFISGSDEVNTVDFLFPTVYEKYNNLEKGMVLSIVGKVEKDLISIKLLLMMLKF